MGRFLDFVFSATGPIAALIVVAIWLRRRPASPAPRRFAIAAAIGFVLAGMSVVPYAASRLLTAGYHAFRADDLPPSRATAIVLLGGGDQFIRGWDDSITVTKPIEAERVLEAARVFALISPAWIISSGGQPDADEPGESSAVTMRDELVRLGVPGGRIVLESRSRNTRENAVFAASTLKSLAIDRVVLVTSDTHMRRSLGAFRAVGIDAIPAVARGGDLPSRWWEWLPTTTGLEWSGRVAHEAGGIVYYWLRGWWRR
jgi:uncharacterized SAM-binding protein YcdF (DUF218 family)